MILHIPHSSTKTPNNFVPDQNTLNVVTDWYTDELFSHWNSVKIIFPFSRLWCDVERFRENDINNQIGQGVIWYKDINQKVIRDVSEQQEQQVYKDYDNHHKQLNSVTKKQLTLFPEIVFVDCHSFSGKQLNKLETELPDFCLGTNDNTPKELVSSICVFLDTQHLSYKINFPYSGSLVPSKFLNSTKVTGIMIEVNKRLYLNQNNTKSKNFKKTEIIINKILDIISIYVLSKDL